MIDLGHSVAGVTLGANQPSGTRPSLALRAISDSMTTLDSDTTGAWSGVGRRRDRSIDMAKVARLALILLVLGLSQSASNREYPSIAFHPIGEWAT